MDETRMKSVRYISEAAVIAAMYGALTVFFAPISSGQIQVRIAEALTILPVFTTAALPGLFVGCLIANIFTGQGIYDILLGPLVTLVAAWLTRNMPVRWMAPLPPIVLNALYVGVLLFYTAELPVIPTMFFVGAGEGIACYIMGYPLMVLLERHRKKIFGQIN